LIPEKFELPLFFNYFIVILIILFFLYYLEQQQQQQQSQQSSLSNNNVASVPPAQTFQQHMAQQQQQQNPNTNNNNNNNSSFSTTTNNSNGKDQIPLKRGSSNVSPSEPPTKKAKSIPATQSNENSNDRIGMLQDAMAKNPVVPQRSEKSDQLTQIFELFRRSAQMKSNTVEIEARLGYFVEANFHSEVMDNHFDTIQKHLESNKQFESEYRETTDYIYEKGLRVSFDEKNKRVLAAIYKNKYEKNDKKRMILFNYLCF